MRKNSSGSSRPGRKPTFKKDSDGGFNKEEKHFKKNYDGRSHSGGDQGGNNKGRRPYSGRVTGGDNSNQSGPSGRVPFRKPFNNNENGQKGREDINQSGRDFNKPKRSDNKPFRDIPDQKKQGLPADRRGSYNKPTHNKEDKKEWGERKPRKEFDRPERSDDRGPYRDNPRNESGERENSFGKPAFKRDDKNGERKPRKEFDKSARSGESRPFKDRPKREHDDKSGPSRDRQGSSGKPAFNKDSYKDWKKRKPRKEFDKPKGAGNDSRPFRDRPKSPADGKRGSSDRPPHDKEKNNETPINESDKGFGNVMDHAFDRPKKEKNKKENIAEPQQFEDQVFGSLEEVDSAIKRPFEKKKTNTPFGKKKFVHDHSEGRKRKVKEEDEDDEDEKEISQKHGPSLVMPLNKYIAHSGECSRRDAAELVKQGKVKVNGELVLEPGYKVQQGDKVTLSGKKLTPQKGMVYILLNKPKGFITTNDDPQGRRTVMELVGNSGVDRLFPVGRLDRNTTGLLLITNDGDLTQKLSHPAFDIKKVYQVTLDKPLTKADFDKIVEGVELEDGIAKVDALAFLEKKNELGLEIHSGRNRIVRRIFESLKYEVEKLDRVMYAGLTKKNLPRSKWRYLDEREVVLLKHFKS